jgi:hypothetical protein
MQCRMEHQFATGDRSHMLGKKEVFKKVQFADLTLVKILISKACLRRVLESTRAAVLIRYGSMHVRISHLSNR